MVSFPMRWFAHRPVPGYEHANNVAEVVDFAFAPSHVDLGLKRCTVQFLRHYAEHLRLRKVGECPRIFDARRVADTPR